jgi:carbon storage regulator
LFFPTFAIFTERQLCNGKRKVDLRKKEPAALFSPALTFAQNGALDMPLSLHLHVKLTFGRQEATNLPVKAPFSLKLHPWHRVCSTMACFSFWKLLRFQHGGPAMLVLTRKPNESIILSDNIVVTVLEVIGQKVRLGIKAPADVTIWRKELVDRQLEWQDKAGEGQAKPDCLVEAGR